MTRPAARQESAVALQRLPWRVASGYAVVGTAWILLSDRLLFGTAPESTGALALSIGKGLLFVAVTATALVVTLRRMTRRITTAHRSADREQQRFAALVRGSSDIIGVIDRGGLLTFASPSVTTVLGWTPEQIAARDVRELIHPDDRELLPASVPALVDGPSSEPVVLRLLTQAGGWRHIEVTCASTDVDPVLEGIVLNGRDVTDRIAAEQALGHARRHDPVTGLRNRHHFEAGIRDLALAARASGDAKLVVSVTDIDRFREINEEVGTTGGDEVLRVVARRITETCPAGGLTGRLGADEIGMAFLTPDDRHVDSNVRLMVQGLRSVLGKPLTAGGREYSLSVSCGAAVCPGDAAPLQALIAAEATVTEAKGLPDRTCVLVDPPTVARGLQSGELHRAFDARELRLHYQPQIHLPTGRITGVEALLRWQHPQRGLLAPDEFLDEIRATGMQPAITRWVLGQATRFVAAMPSPSPLTLSVNLFLDDLSRPELVGEVLWALERGGLDACRLRLELTEHALLVKPELSLRTMDDLRAHGLTFSIDDFGTGYSSLAHLRAMPVDELKIDRSFVTDIADRRSHAIVCAVLELGRRIGIPTIAEGIEDAETLTALVELGCEHGQGYLLSEPLTEEQLVRYMQDQQQVS